VRMSAARVSIPNSGNLEPDLVVEPGRDEAAMTEVDLARALPEQEGSRAAGGQILDAADDVARVERNELRAVPARILVDVY